jgi:cytochrome c oxidase subunit IV
MTATFPPHRGPTMNLYVVVWIGLILIVGLEVFLTYERLPAGMLLACLLGLALIEAGLGVMYFMHLKYERPALFWSLIPYLVFALVMMDHFWPDALRLMRQRMQGP